MDTESFSNLALEMEPPPQQPLSPALQRMLRDETSSHWFASPVPWSFLLAELLLLHHYHSASSIDSGRRLLLWVGLAWLAPILGFAFRVGNAAEPHVQPRRLHPEVCRIVALWVLTVAVTGGFQSAAFFVALGTMASLWQLSVGLRVFAMLAAAVGGGGLYVLAKRFELPLPAVQWPGAAIDSEGIAMLVFVIVLLLAYGFLLREILPIPGTYFFHETDPIQGYDRSQERLLRSILVRALKIYDADAARLAWALPRKRQEAPGFRLDYGINWEPQPGNGSHDDLAPDWLRPLLLAAIDRGHANLNRFRSLGRYWNGTGWQNVCSVLVICRGPEIEPAESRLFVLLSGRPFAFLLPTRGLAQIFWSEVVLLLQWATQIALWRKLMSDARDLETYQKILSELCTMLAPRAIRPLIVDLKVRPSNAREPHGNLAMPTADNRTVFVSTAVALKAEGRLRQRIHLSVLVDRAALLHLDDDLAAVARTRIRRFVVDLLRGPLIQVLLDLYQYGRRGDWSPRGTAKLIYSPEVEQKIAAYDPAKGQGDDFEGFGFQIESVNAWMRAWLPWLPKKFEEGDICWKRYLQPELMGASGHPGQTGACPGCPVIKQVHRYQTTVPTTPGVVAYDAYPAPAPCGERRIIRHLYLACRVEVPPDGGSVAYLDEEVEDRTTRMETDAFAEWLQSPAAAKAVREQGRPILYGRLADGAGRIFHADYVFLVEVAGATAGRLEAAFRRRTLDCTPDESALILGEEWALIQQMRANEQGYSYYFAHRKPLFATDPASGAYRQEFTRHDIVSALEDLATKSRVAGRASEAVSSTDQAGFWAACEPPLGILKRLVVAPIPTTNLALVIATGAPERWERRDLDKSEHLLPRREEMNSVHDMCERLGNAINGLGLTPQVYLEIHRRIEQGLEHELTHLLDPMRARADLLRDFIDDGIPVWEKARAYLAEVGGDALLDEWSQTVSAASRILVFLPNVDVIAATKSMCMAATGGISESWSHWEMLAQLGLNGQKLRGLERLRPLAPDQRLLITQHFCHVAHLAEAAEELYSAERHARRVFFLPKTSAELMRRPMNVLSVVHDVVRGFTHHARRFVIVLAVPPTIEVELYVHAFTMMAQLLITNALQAVTKQPPQEAPAIEISAEMRDSRLVFRVANRGPQITEPQRLFFNRTESSAGGSGTGLANAQRQAQTNHGNLYYEYQNGFNIFVFQQDHDPQ